MSPNPLMGLVGFWMLLKLVGVLAALAGLLAFLYYLSRVAIGLERMASAFEEFVAEDKLKAAAKRPVVPPMPPVPSEARTGESV